MFNRKKLRQLQEEKNVLEARLNVLTEWIGGNVKMTAGIIMNLDELNKTHLKLVEKVEPVVRKVHDQTAIDLAYHIRNTSLKERDSNSIGGKEYYRIPVSFIDGIILGAKDEVKE